MIGVVIEAAYLDAIQRSRNCFIPWDILSLWLPTIHEPNRPSKWIGTETKGGNKVIQGESSNGFWHINFQAPGTSSNAKITI